jgi:hypothetical protein
MGLLSLSDFQGEIVSAVGNRTDITLAQCIKGINFAQDEIAKAADFQELETYQQLVTSFTGVPIVDKFLPFSSSWKTIHSIVLQNDTESRKLRQMPWRKFDRLYPCPEIVAAYIPLVYSQWAQQLIFMPVPNAAYPLQCRVTMQPTPFTINSLTTQTSQYVAQDQTIISFAAAYLWRAKGRYDKADEYTAIGNQMLEASLVSDGNRPDMDTSGDADSGEALSGAYWANPWVTSVDGV